MRNEPNLGKKVVSAAVLIVLLMFTFVIVFGNVYNSVDTALV